MKALLLIAGLLMSVAAGANPAPAKDAHADRTPSQGRVVTPVGSIDPLGADVQTTSLEMVCSGRTCCFWGNKGDFWLCSRL